MRILLVQDADWTKKGPHQQHHLMELLSIKGHKVQVIGYNQLWKREGWNFISKRVDYKNVCRFYKDAKIDYIQPSFIKILILDYLSFFISSRIEIRRAQKEFKPDIIIGVTSILSNYWGVKSANEHNIPFIYYWTDVIHTLVPFEPFRWVAKIMEKIIIKKSTKLMVINEELKDFVIELGADPNTIQVVPGGIDFRRFNPHIDPSPIRKKYGLSENDFVAYFMGWIYEFSGIKEMLLEFVKYKDSHLNLKFLIVGEGEYFSNIRNLVESNNLEEQVVLAGLRPYEEIPQLIAASDVCLLPSRNNDIMDRIVPIKMYEYLSMHKPVISTKLPGVMKEFGQDNGVIYVDSPEEVIKKLIELEANYSDIDIDKIRNFIEKYNWDDIVPNFEESIRSLVVPN